MAKYYVQSGTMRTVVDAQDARRAALWAVHKAMQQIMPIYDDAMVSPEAKSELAATEGIFVLDATVQLSEQGFDRHDAQAMETFGVVTEWHQLMVALDRLQRLL